MNKDQQRLIDLLTQLTSQLSKMSANRNPTEAIEEIKKQIFEKTKIELSNDLFRIFVGKLMLESGYNKIFNIVEKMQQELNVEHAKNIEKELDSAEGRKLCQDSYNLFRSNVFQIYMNLK